MGTSVHLPYVSVVNIPHYCDEIPTADWFIKKGRFAHSSGEVFKVMAQQQLDLGEDFMSSQR